MKEKTLIFYSHTLCRLNDMEIVNYYYQQMENTLPVSYKHCAVNVLCRNHAFYAF